MQDHGEPVASRTDGQRGFVAHERSELQTGGDVATGGVHRREVRTTVAVDDEWDDHDDGVTLGDNGGGVGAGPDTEPAATTSRR
jgi:hypothetical protein